jgi:HEAT repeat protein
LREFKPVDPTRPVDESVEARLARVRRSQFWLKGDEQVWDSLAEFGAPAVPNLIAALNDKKPSVCGAAAGALGRIGDPRAVEPLIAVLAAREEAGWVKVAAADALGRLGDPRALKPLLTALRAVGIDLSCAAAKALGELGDRGAVDSLIKVLSKRHLGPTPVLWTVRDLRSGRDS